MAHYLPLSLIAAAACLTMAAQSTPANHPLPSSPDSVRVVIDSIDFDQTYLLVTVMTESFTPYDYTIVPARKDQMTIDMRKPVGCAPFSVIAFEDFNLNRRLDINSRGIPAEKSAVAHCMGNERQVELILKRYDLIIDAIERQEAAADTISVNDHAPAP